MIRRVIQIDADKCSGCGLCAEACHEGAIAVVDGKARLIKDEYCDGLGDCLPQCPTGAISFVEREAAAYDESAVAANKKAKAASGKASRLGNWPCQIKLVPVKAAFFSGARLLVAADCTAFAYADIQNGFMDGKVTLNGCPKLDAVDYSQKLSDILQGNEIESVTVLRMEVPCCGGLEAAVKRAAEYSGKDIPINTVIISTDGRVVR